MLKFVWGQVAKVVAAPSSRQDFSDDLNLANRNLQRGNEDSS